MTQIELNEAHHWPGEWHLQEQPNKKIAGSLRWDKRAILELNDAFDNLKSGPLSSDDGDHQAVIHGISSKGQLVTVLEADRSSQQFNFDASGGIRRPTTCRATWAIFGTHCTKETTFTSCRFVVPGLELWLNQAWHEIQIQKGRSHISLNSPEPITVSLQEIECEIEIATTVVLGTQARSEVSGKAKGVITIRSPSGKSLDWYLEKLGTLTDLLALLGGSSFAPSSMEVQSDELQSRASVLVALAHKPCEFQHFNDFYLLNSNAGVSIESLIPCWFRNYEAIQMPLRLTLSAFHSRDLWVHVEFLTYMQCLEGFHRALYSGTYMAQEKFEQAAQQIVGAIPKDLSVDHKTSLKSRIRYGNEISLTRRLKELCEPLPTNLRTLIFGAQQKPPQRWVDTRNYYTHWDAASKAKALSYIEMHQASLRIRHWLRALFLLHIGIPQEAVLKGAQGAHGDSQYLLQINGASFGRIEHSE